MSEIEKRITSVSLGAEYFTVQSNANETVMPQESTDGKKISQPPTTALNLKQEVVFPVNFPPEHLRH